MRSPAAGLGGTHRYWTCGPVPFALRRHRTVLIDLDAITLSVGRMVGDGVVGGPVASLAVLLAAAVNQGTKLVLSWVLDGRSLALKVLPADARMALVGGGTALALR